MGTVTIYPAVCTVCKKGHNQWDVDSKGRCKDCRIAALEAENAVMRRCLTDIRDNYDCDGYPGEHEKHCRCCKADGALSYKHAPTLTPKGGGK